MFELLRKRSRMTLIACFLAVFAPTVSLAHPHVWVEVQAELEFEEGRLASIRQRWLFDEFFSSVLFEDFDRNGNGQFEAEEILAMRNGAFEGLGELNFFTDLRIGGAQVLWQGAREFDVILAEDGSIAYTFTLDLPEPADMLAQAVTLSLYDPDYYVSIDFEPGPSIGYQDMVEQSCTYQLEESEDVVVYFGSIYPVRAVFECSGLTG